MTEFAVAAWVMDVEVTVSFSLTTPGAVVLAAEAPTIGVEGFELSTVIGAVLVTLVTTPAPPAVDHFNPVV